MPRTAIVRQARKTPFQRQFNENLENLRDDCIALFVNSKLTQKQVHERGGPTPNTISRWLYRETMFPRLATVQSFVLALGCRLTVISNVANATGIDTQEKRLNIIKAHPKMPPRPRRMKK